MLNAPTSLLDWRCQSLFLSDAAFSKAFKRNFDFAPRKHPRSSDYRMI
jgi:hypothetical protein